MCLGFKKRKKAVCYIMDSGYKSEVDMGLRPSIVADARTVFVASFVQWGLER